MQLKLEEPDSVAALLSSKITLKPCEGVNIETKVRMYGTKEMRIRLNFIPRGTKAEEVYDWCIKSGFGEPSKIVRCTFDGIEGEAVDVVLSPNSDVNWMDEQTKYQRHGTFCGLTCKFTYTCLTAVSKKFIFKVSCIANKFRTWLKQLQWPNEFRW